MKQTPEQFRQQIEAMVLPLAQKLGTRNGFFEYWFQILPRCKTQKAAFDFANLLHLKIFKEEKYISFDSFYKQKNLYLKGLSK
jgi:hypothetical protein